MNKPATLETMTQKLTKNGKKNELTQQNHKNVEVKTQNSTTQIQFELSNSKTSANSARTRLQLNNKIEN